MVHMQFIWLKLDLQDLIDFIVVFCQCRLQIFTFIFLEIPTCMYKLSCILVITPLFVFDVAFYKLQKQVFFYVVGIGWAIVMVEWRFEDLNFFTWWSFFLDLMVVIFIIIPYICGFIIDKWWKGFVLHFITLSKFKYLLNNNWLV